MNRCHGKKDETSEWQERFEALARAKDIKDNEISATEPTSKMTDLFLTVVGKEGYSQIKTLLAPELPSTKNMKL